MNASRGFALRPVSAGVAPAIVLILLGCGRDGRSTPESASESDASSTTAAQPACSHLVCGSNFFVDADPPADCSPGSTCTLGLTLVATGSFHINDEYPYKFKADDSPGIEFLGSDAAGKNVFSKVASDWKKRDEKTGTMAIKLRPLANSGNPTHSKGEKTVAGTFKLSVCSGQLCQLEQQALSTKVAVR